MIAPTALALLLAAAQAPQPPPLRSRAEPVNPLSDYISADDYPLSVLRARREGVVSYRLSIDEDGFAFACAVLESSAPAALDVATCRILRTRTRFVPARDRAGRRAPDVMTGTVRWVLAEGDLAYGELPFTHLPAQPTPPPVIAAVPPPPPPPPPRRPSEGREAVPTHPYSFYLGPADYPAAARQGGQEGRVEFELSIAATGRVVGCAVPESSGSPLLDAATCRILRARARYEPARGPAGQPRPDTEEGFFVWRLPQP